MKSYGLDLQHSGVRTTTDQVITGDAFPANPSKGAIFFLTQKVGTDEIGSYTFNGTKWITGDITSVMTGAGLIGGGTAGDLTLSIDANYVVLDTDKRITDANTIKVKKNPGKGEFATITEALSSITDNSTTQTYCIEVSAGVFIESQIVCKPFVYIRGRGPGATIIKAYDVNHHLVLGCERGAIVNCTITNVTGLNQAAVYYAHPTGDTNLAFLVDGVKFGNNHTHALCTSGNLIMSNVTYGSIFQFTRGFVVQDDGVHDARINIRSSTSSGMVAPFPEMLFAAIGPKSQILTFGVIARASSTLTGASDVGTGLYLSNGGRCRVLATSLVGFSKGVWCENAGVGPVVSAVGLNLENNLMDIVVDHPGTTGSITGVAAKSRSTINPLATISVLYTDLESPGTVAAGPLYLGPTHNKVANVSPLLVRGMQLGVMDGGTLLRGTGLNIQVAAGNGYCRVNGTLVNVTWPALTVPVPANLTFYLYLDSTGTPLLAASMPDNVANIVLGRFLSNATSVLLLSDDGSTVIETFHPNIDKLLRLGVGVVFASGCIVTENATTPRAIDVTAGHYFYSAKERNTIGQSPVPGFIMCHHSAGAVALDGMLQVDNTSYDDGVNLSPLTAGYYNKHVLYTGGDGSLVKFMFAFGTGNYATLEAAIAAPLPNLLLQSDGSPPIAAVIVQQGNNHIVQIIDVRPRVGFAAQSSASANRHGDLLGLAADDHVQYLLADGSRPMIGPLNMNNKALTNVASVNGLDFTTHGARHLPNGLDPITTAAAVTLTSASTNTVGVANSLARSDHTHAITFPAAPVSSVNTKTGAVVLSTTDVAEGTSLYFTNARASAAAPVQTVAGRTGAIVLTSSDVAEGTNQYFTTARASAAAPVQSVNAKTGAIVLSTTDVAEGNNKYYTDARARAAFTTTNALILNSATGLLGTRSNLGQLLTGVVGIASGTTLISVDNTAPLITEGTQLWSASVTPLSATSNFLIDFSCVTSVATNNRSVTLALFRNSTLIGWTTVWQDAGAPKSASIKVLDSPATTAAVTYSLRVGISTSGNTWYIGRTSLATMGGANNAAWSILEIL